MQEATLLRYIRNPEPVALSVISVWEATALLTGRVPTVTSQVMRLPRPARIGLCAAVAYWMAHHFDLVS